MKQPIKIVAAGLLFAGVVTGAWLWLGKDNRGSNSEKQASSTNQQTAKNRNTAETDYLEIREWKIGVSLPPELWGKVAYQLDEPVTDPDGNKLQAAKLLLKNDPAAKNECVVIEVLGGLFIDTATQILRAESDKPFDSDRYKGTFRKNILEESNYVYHLNYVIPDCADPDSVTKIKQLQNTMERLEKIE